MSCNYAYSISFLITSLLTHVSLLKEVLKMFQKIEKAGFEKRGFENVRKKIEKKNRNRKS